MKTKFILCFAALAMTLSSYSQMKIFPGGSISIGSITSPTLNGVTHHVVGNTTAFLANTSAAAASAPLVVGQNAVSSSPGFAFLGDHQTGIAHPASSILAVTIANSEKYRFNSSGQILNMNSSSSASSPDYSWNSDANTGFFRGGNNIIGISTGGNERIRINNTGQLFSCTTNANQALPDYSWSSDSNTGIYNPSADIIGFSTGGTERVRINNNCQILCNSSSSSASTPEFSWANDANTGIFRASSDMIGFSTAGSERVRIDANGKLGIGTTSPSEKLHLVGNAILNGSVTVDGWTDVLMDWTGPYSAPVLYPSSDWYLHLGKSTNKLGDAFFTHVITVNLTVTSDKNVKQNINYDLSQTRTKLKQLKPASYKFRSNVAPNAPVAVQNKITSTTEYGFIAQDLISVFPELVEQDPETGLYGVKYLEFIPLLVNAYTEQQNELDNVKQQLSECCDKSNQRINTDENKSEFGFNSDYSGSSYIKQNVPNPFNKETNIDYFIAERNASSSILIFDMNGKLLRTFNLNGSGQGTLNIVGNELAPGMYYYSLIVNAKEVGTKKMILTE